MELLHGCMSLLIKIISWHSGILIVVGECLDNMPDTVIVM